jgi:GMP synthase-like glutamine amidotransferase
LAEILGGKVYAAPHKEIGWFEIKLSDEALNGLFKGSPETIQVFHWHGDTYTLPDKAVRLASSEATINQGFVYEDYVLGLQFHFEVDDKAINGMNSAFDHELVKSKYVQTDVEIKSQIGLVSLNNDMMFKLLDNFIG